MQVDKVDGGGVRLLVTGLIVNRAVLGAVAARYKRGMIGDRWADLIAGWCVDYYRQYKKAPGRRILTLFDEWSATGKDRDTVQVADAFLTGLADDYAERKREIVPEFVIDVAGRVMNGAGLTGLKEGLEDRLDDGDVEGAIELVQSFRRVELGVGSGINALDDREAIERAFEARSADLFAIPGALGHFLKGSFGRDQFVGLMGKAKIGKSWWLQEIVWLSLTHDRNVAWFQCGDMSEAETLLRLASRAGRRPIDAGRVHWPRAFQPDDRENPVERDSENYPDAMTSEEAYCYLRRYARKHGRDRLKLVTAPANSISVGDIESVLESWELDGWRPDVIVVDYADILAPLNSRTEYRHQINETWTALRAMSTRLHNLVVTATQTDADSYETWLLSRKNFTDDRRKFDHVTAMLGLNQSAGEHVNDVYRANWLARRGLPYSETKYCWVAACLEVGCPFVLSEVGADDARRGRRHRDDDEKPAGSSGLEGIPKNGAARTGRRIGG